MAAQFTDLAVDSLADYLEANYETYLRTVETACGLNEGDLPDPDAYVRADMPLDNRVRMDIWEDGWEPGGDDGDDIHFRTKCTVAWTRLGDADREAGELIARRCLTALILCLRGSSSQRYSLGGTVKAIYLLDGSSATFTDENGDIRHLFEQGVVVETQEQLS